MTNEINSLLQALRSRLQENDYDASAGVAYNLYLAIKDRRRVRAGGDLGICRQCGAQFLRGKRGSVQVYCSPSCAILVKTKRAMMREHDARMARRIGRTCAHCSQPIHVDTINSAKYCSSECRYRAKWQRYREARASD